LSETDFYQELAGELVSIEDFGEILLNYKGEFQFVMIDKFNVGLLDLLSILLPGGFMAGLAWQHRWSSDLMLLQDIPAGWVSGATFIAFAYVLGHFIHLVASFLDNWIYDNIKEKLWPDRSLVNHVIQIKEEAIGTIDGRYFNTFKWSLAYLMQHQPTMYQAVERYIAESKFFRSFAVVLLIASIAAFARFNWSESVLSLILTILSLLRYLTQRQKSTESAYQYVIAARGKV
jgi:hypothetical protein